MKNVNLQETLDQYRHGKRGLLTYEELVQLDVQIAILHARVAALTSSLMIVVHEQVQAQYLTQIEGHKK